MDTLDALDRGLLIEMKHEWNRVTRGTGRRWHPRVVRCGARVGRTIYMVNYEGPILNNNTQTLYFKGSPVTIDLSLHPLDFVVEGAP